MLDKNQELKQINIEYESDKIEKILKNYGVEIKCVNIKNTLSYRIYEIDLQNNNKKYRIRDVESLKIEIGMYYDDIDKIIIEPIPKKNLLGIFMRKKEKETLLLGTLIDNKKEDINKNNIPIIFGTNIYGDIITKDLTKMPHMIIAGTTGTGKTTFLNEIIIQLISNFQYDEIKLLLVDTRCVNFPLFNKIPHMLIPTITEERRVEGALAWLTKEIKNRFNLFRKKDVRNIEGYNEIAKNNKELELPRIILIIDDYADLVDICSDISNYICYIAQEARAAGIHLILSTYRPSREVINGVIKANISTKFTFKVASYIDSNVILDQGGAEKIEKGEALLKSNGYEEPELIIVPYISESNIKEIIKENEKIMYDEKLLKDVLTNENEKIKEQDEALKEVDPLLEETTNKTYNEINSDENKSKMKKWIIAIAVIMFFIYIINGFK